MKSDFAKKWVKDSLEIRQIREVGGIMSSRHNYNNRMQFDLSEVKEPVVQRKYHWNVEKINDQEYRATPA